MTGGAFLLTAFGGMAYGYLSDNGALLIAGFWMFLVSLALVDLFSERRNNNASDSLKVLGRERIAYDDQEPRRG